jgi:Ca2+-binding EF-hand superfamily protein
MIIGLEHNSHLIRGVLKSLITRNSPGVSSSELRKLLKQPIDYGMNDEDLRSIFASIDVDNRGKIDIPKLKTAMSNLSERCFFP